MIKTVGQTYRKHWLPLTFGPLLKLIEAIFDLLIPLFMKAIIDLNQYHEPSLIPNNITSELASFIRIFGSWNSDTYLSDALIGGTIILVMGILGFLITMCSQFIAARTAVIIAREIRESLFDKYLSLSKAEQEQIGYSRLITVLNSDTYQLQTGVLLLTRLIIRAPFIILGSLIFSFILDWRIGLAFTIIVPLLVAINIIVLSKSKKNYIKIQEGLDDISTHTSDTILGARVIRASNKQNDENKTFETYTSTYQSRAKKVNFINALINPLTFAVTSLVTIIILFVIRESIFSGDESYRLSMASAMVAEMAYLAQIFFTTVQLTMVLIDLTKASVSRKRINEVLSIDSSIKQGNLTYQDNYQDVMRFDHVYFSYDGGDNYSLKDISFTLKKGETLGIIGGTGSGKSSIISLVERFYQHQKGDIYFKDANVNDLQISTLRKEISYVPQKSSLLKGSIRTNLSLGLKVDEETLKEALREAEAYEFVYQYEDNLDHEVLENGSNFSGGQKQRLCIARALVKRQDILILDDATSALDLLTESKIRNNIKNKHLTTIIVSQRISSIMKADHILVMHKGRIVNEGNHESLLAESSIYREIYETQLKEKEHER